MDNITGILTAIKRNEDHLKMLFKSKEQGAGTAIVSAIIKRVELRALESDGDRLKRLIKSKKDETKDIFGFELSSEPHPMQGIETEKEWRARIDYILDHIACQLQKSNDFTKSDFVIRGTVHGVDISLSIQEDGYIYVTIHEGVYKNTYMELLPPKPKKITEKQRKKNIKNIILGR